MNQKQRELFAFYSTTNPSKRMHFINCALTPYEANNFFIELGESLDYMKEEKERLEMLNPGDGLIEMEMGIQIKDMENLREDLKNSYEYNPKFYNSMNDFFTKGYFDLSNYSEEEKKMFSEFLGFNKPEEDEEDIYGLREKIENKQTKLTGKRTKHRKELSIDFIHKKGYIMKQKFKTILAKYSVENSNRESMQLINCTLRPYEVNDFLIDLNESLEYMKVEQEKLKEWNTSGSPVLYEYNRQIRDIEDLLEDLKNSYEFNPKFHNTLNKIFSKENVQFSNYSDNEKKLFSEFLDIHKPEVEGKPELKIFFEDVQSNLKKRPKHRFHP